jgi:hypothetical protein
VALRIDREGTRSGRFKRRRQGKLRFVVTERSVKQDALVSGVRV